jgi:pilus assembly protein CpaF
MSQAEDNQSTAITASKGPLPAAPAERFLHYKQQLHTQLISRMDFSVASKISEDELRRAIKSEAEELCRRSSELLSLAERDQLVAEILDEAFGLGPLEPLLRDPTISDILVNGYKVVYLERRGQLEHIPYIRFHDDQHLLQIIQRIAGRVGRRVDETEPMVDARLPDGSRVNAVIPPIALDGPLLSIRRFGARPLRIADLVLNKSITPDMVQFLAACVRGRLNVLISGGTGSGKTTLMNAISIFIPEEDRVATIEDAAEMRLQQPHVIRLETRPANIEGHGEITTRDLVRNALRMRPDRIIIGECRGAEALDTLQAMNTGRDGSLTTIHANDTEDALSRLEMMVGMARFDVPIWIIRAQIASAIHIVVQAARLAGGARKIVKVSEILGLEGHSIKVMDIFGFKQTGVSADGQAEGHFYATGVQPICMERLAASGQKLPQAIFERREIKL